jgi:hypothetical protein
MKNPLNSYPPSVAISLDTPLQASQAWGESLELRPNTNSTDPLIDLPSFDSKYLE